MACGVEETTGLLDTNCHFETQGQARHKSDVSSMRPQDGEKFQAYPSVPSQKEKKKDLEYNAMHQVDD
jgi:hypothetical protein